MENLDNYLKTHIDPITWSDHAPIYLETQEEEVASGFIKGRRGGDNIRKLLHVIDLMGGRLDSTPFVALDAEKAFDRVEWRYFSEALSAYGFEGPVLRSILIPQKQTKKTLLAKLHYKYALKPWTETFRLVRYCLDKPLGNNLKDCSYHPVLKCKDILQDAVKEKSLSVLLTRIESISKQRGLESHLGPNGRTCYITSEMFYIEVQVKRNGNVDFVKIAYHGEAPKNCLELHRCLRIKDFNGFGRNLEGLLNLYNIPGNSDTKAKVYNALQCLEADLQNVFDLESFEIKDKVTAVLHGKVGYLTPRMSGTPMKIEYYVSPYKLLDEKLNPGSPVVGDTASVTVMGTKLLHQLQISQLFNMPQEKESSIPNKLSAALPACFSFTFFEPVLLTLPVIQKTQNITDCKDQCYYIHCNKEDHATDGTLVNCITFTNPSHIPPILELLRQQTVFNTLVCSCISSNTNTKACAELLHFEVSLRPNFSICISFQHPTGFSLCCVSIDVVSSRQFKCNIYTDKSDPPFPCTEEFIIKVMESCLSIPVTMRTIFKKVRKVKPESETEISEPSSEQAQLEQSTVDFSQTAFSSLQLERPQETQYRLCSMDKDIVQAPSESANGSAKTYSSIAHVSTAEASCAEMLDGIIEEQPHPTCYTLKENVIGLPDLSPIEDTSLAEDTSLTEDMSPIMEENLSSMIAEEPSIPFSDDANSSVTEKLSSNITDALNISFPEELSSSITEELALSIPRGFMVPDSINKNETDDQYEMQ
ncbi:mediator of RNA polymerase II transcription subunit 1-like [Pelodytes ibericus]